MKFGYARVSKTEQCLEVQIQKLKAAGCDEIFMEKASGAKNDRKELMRMQDKLRRGDIVCVVRLDRPGRRMMKLIELINDFKEKGIDFVSLENSLDTSSITGMLIFNIFAAFSEMERELIRERIIAGLEVAHQKGRYGGRPKSVTPEKLVTLLSLRKSQDFPVSEICKMTGITRSVYYRAVSGAAGDGSYNGSQI
jgi:DNA invertase Pin-like site-specific DNA recombinase